MKTHRHANVEPHTEEQRREQSEEKWNVFLNTTFGIVGFSLGLACLTSKTPSINAGLSLAFLILTRIAARRLIPSHFKDPRQHRERSQVVKDQLKFWVNTLPGVFGYVYLCLIASSWLISQYFASFHTGAWFLQVMKDYVGPT